MQVIDYTKYIRPEIIPIAIALWCIGLFMKKSNYFYDNMIPVLLLLISIIITPLYMIFVLNIKDNEYIGVIISGIIQGIFAAALAVFGNELKRNAQKKDIS